MSDEERKELEDLEERLLEAEALLLTLRYNWWTSGQLKGQIDEYFMPKRSK